MNKVKFINEIRDNTSRVQAKADIEDIIDTAIQVIINQVSSGNSVQLIGFGTFEVATHPARCGRNPQTGQTMEIPEKKIPKFKAGKAFKDAVNQA